MVAFFSSARPGSTLHATLVRGFFAGCDGAAEALTSLGVALLTLSRSSFPHRCHTQGTTPPGDEALRMRVAGKVLSVCEHSSLPGSTDNNEAAWPCTMLGENRLGM